MLTRKRALGPPPKPQSITVSAWSTTFFLSVVFVTSAGTVYADIPYVINFFLPKEEFPEPPPKRLKPQGGSRLGSRIRSLGAGRRRVPARQGPVQGLAFGISFRRHTWEKGRRFGLRACVNKCYLEIWSQNLERGPS